MNKVRVLSIVLIVLGVCALGFGIAQYRMAGSVVVQPVDLPTYNMVEASEGIMNVEVMMDEESEGPDEAYNTVNGDVYDDSVKSEVNDGSEDEAEEEPVYTTTAVVQPETDVVDNPDVDVDNVEDSVDTGDSVDIGVGIGTGE